MEYDDQFGCLEALLEADPVGASRPTKYKYRGVDCSLSRPATPPHPACCVSGCGGVKMKAASSG